MPYCFFYSLIPAFGSSFVFLGFLKKRLNCQHCFVLYVKAPFWFFQLPIASINNGFWSLVQEYHQQEESQRTQTRESEAPEKINQQKEPLSEKEHFVPTNSVAVGHQGRLGPSIEDVSAIRIQTAYRAYLARKTVRRMRGMLRLQNLVECDSVKKQASITLSHLHSWNKIQSQIRARRVHMVTEGRLRQKKLESQLKLEAKLHDLEVEWSGGTETMDVALARIHHREEAAVSGGRTRVQVSDQIMMNLAKQTGAGAGWIAGLLLALGKAEFQLGKVPRKRLVANQASLGKIPLPHLAKHPRKSN